MRIMGEDDYVLNSRDPYPQLATHIRPTAEVVCSHLVQSNLSFINQAVYLPEGLGIFYMQSNRYDIETSELDNLSHILKQS